MDGTIVRYSDITIGRDRQLFALLGIAKDINDELVARAQHIVLRRGNIHLRLKCQRAIIENISTEDFLTLLFLLFEIKGIGTLIHHGIGISIIEPVVWTIHHHLLLITLLSLVINLTHRGIVLAHTIRGIANGFVGYTTHAGFLQLAGIFLAHLLDLFQGRTFLQQFLGDIGLSLTCFLLLHDILENLSLSHSLTKGCRRQTYGQ